MTKKPSLPHCTGGLAIVIVLILTWASLFAPSAVAQETTETDTSDLSLRDVLEQNRYPLQLSDGRLRDRGGRWLVERAAEATVISLGESHGTQEIPRIMGALIDELQREGELDHLALEISPWTARRVTDSLRAGPAVYESFVRRHPAAVPFYNLRSERDLIQNFVHHSEAERPLWGLDQLFFFGTTLALDRLQDLAPTPVARDAVDRVQAIGAADSTVSEAVANLPPGMPPPLEAHDPLAVDTLHPHFEGVPEALRIIDEFSTSIPIYRLNSTDNYRSNQMRARYMRRNLQRAYRRAETQSQSAPEVAIKVGGRHAYRDRTPNNALDVGNLAVALAEHAGGTALNVLVACGPGAQGWDFPSGASDCFNDQLEPFASVMTGDHPALFDLTAVHPLLHEDKLSHGDERERLLWGFDVVVLVPNATPSEPIAPLIDR